LRFFSPPEKPSFTGRFINVSSISSELHFLAHYLKKVHRIKLVEAAVLPNALSAALRK
jgi:hypothetical protein